MRLLMHKLNRNKNDATTNAHDITPDESGHFGVYGGRFVSETLIGPLEELENAYKKYIDDPEFNAEFKSDLKHFVGRPSPLYYAESWSEKLGGAKIYLKRCLLYTSPSPRDS